MLGVTNLLTPLSYANAADDYDSITFPKTAQSFSFLMPAHHVYLYATTEANKYFVNYHGGTGASWTMPKDTFTYDSHSWHLAPNQFVKTWYTWSSWNTGADGQGTRYASGAEVFNWTTVESGDEHVYAQWSANRYNIEYVLNDTGTSQAIHPQTPTWAAYDEDITIVKPTRVWYSFSGWHIVGMDDVEHKIGSETSTATSEDYVDETEFRNLRATEGTVTFGARWRAENVKYTVNHFQEKLEGWYPETPTDVVTGSATADEYMTWATTTYEWFTTPAESGQIIDANGTTVFNYYYVRNSYPLTLIAGRWIVSVTVTGDNSTGGTNAWSHDYSIKYWDKVTLSYEVEDWYESADWSGGTAPSFTMPATGQVREAYAVPTTYSITTNLVWGTATNRTGYNKETGTFSLNNPTGTKSTFLWWIGTDLSWTQLTVTIEQWSTWNRIYTAQWRCDTWYHASNSTGSEDINYGNCIANTETPFTIEYYEQSLTWSYVLTNTWSDHGETDTNTAVTPDDREWFTTQTVVPQKIEWDGSTVVKVYYNRNTYAGTITPTTGITWADANGANSDSISALKYGDTVALSADVEPGYTFSEWTVSGPSGDVTVTNPTSINNATFTMPAWPVTITPHVTVNDYTITLHKNWGTSADADTIPYTVESEDITLKRPTRPNSEFKWWTWSNGGTEELDVTIEKWSTWNRNYYAVWDCNAWYTASDDGQSCEANPYTVIIDYNDDDHPGNVEKSFVYNVTGTIPNPSKSWYDFAWWTVSWASSTATVDWEALTSPTSGTEFKNLTTTSGGTVTLTATWTPKEDTEYTVYYYTAELSGGYTLADTKTWTYTSDQDIAVSGLADAIVWYVTPTEWYTAWGTSGPSGSGQTAITIDRHGTTEIYLFYDRGRFHVYLSGDEHIIPSSLQGEGDYDFWATVNVSAEAEPWYHFKHWEKRWTGFAELP